jgi:Mce-associated membrane protein
VSDAEVLDTDAVETEPAPSPSTNRAYLVSLVVLCAVFFAGMVALSIIAVDQRSARSHANDDRRRVQEVASLLTSRLLTYDYAHIDESKAPVLALATGKFRDDYERSFEGLKQLLVTAKATQSGTPQEVYVSSIDGGTAHVIVIASIEHNGTGGRAARPDAYLRLSLVKVAGSWKVDDVTDLNFSQQAPTSTTVPGK